MNVINKRAHRWVPGITLLGAVLVIAATLLHPITIDPWNTDMAVHFISTNRLFWMWDHALMTAAIILWLGGLAACFQIFRAGHPYSILVIVLFTASIAIWLVALEFELGGLPISINKLQSHSDPVQQSLVASLFASVLLSGYLAMIPAWLGVTFGAQSKWGVFSGSVGVAGIVYCLIEPTLWLLAVTSAVPFVWTLFFCWQCLRRK